MKSWRLTISESLYSKLNFHLFPGDDDEHGAVILAGVSDSDRGLRLVARELYLATDGVDYVPGHQGYRMLKAEFIQKWIIRAREKRLAYLAIHNHGGDRSVAFSGTDLASHERGYPALLDIARGMPVGALVFARSAVAGDLWLPSHHRSTLNRATVIGNRRFSLYPTPRSASSASPMYDRQSRLFGDVGQELLRQTRVGIVGLGGAGSILAELLGRLGVGEFVLADPERVEITNLPRLVGAFRREGLSLSWIPQFVRHRFQKFKVRIAKRNIRRANPKAHVIALRKNFIDDDVALRFKDCDFLFLAADTMQARLLFNALVHQYGIVGIQVGAKIPVDDDGKVGNVFCVSRLVTPEYGCLWCNGLISPGRLQDEAISDMIKQEYSYLNDPDVIAPSVITLNAIACAHATDEFLFHLTGLKHRDAEIGWFRWNSRSSKAGYDIPRKDSQCTECSLTDNSRLGMCDNKSLPTRPRASKSKLS